MKFQKKFVLSVLACLGVTFAYGSYRHMRTRREEGEEPHKYLTVHWECPACKAKVLVKDTELVSNQVCPMCQTKVELVSDRIPVIAKKVPEDGRVCGKCKHYLNKPFIPYYRYDCGICEYEQCLQNKKMKAYKDRCHTGQFERKETIGGER